MLSEVTRTLQAVRATALLLIEMQIKLTVLLLDSVCT